MELLQGCQLGKPVLCDAKAVPQDESLEGGEGGQVSDTCVWGVEGCGERTKVDCVAHMHAQLTKDNPHVHTRHMTKTQLHTTCNNMRHPNSCLLLPLVPTSVTAKQPLRSKCVNLVNPLTACSVASTTVAMRPVLPMDRLHRDAWREEARVDMPRSVRSMQPERSRVCVGIWWVFVGLCMDDFCGQGCVMKRGQ